MVLFAASSQFDADRLLYALPDGSERKDEEKEIYQKWKCGSKKDLFLLIISILTL
jgi:hypothetical protein